MIISYAAFLFAVWLLLSGHFEPLMLGLGLASVLLTVILIRRMTLIDHESYPLHLSTKIPAYLIFILREIVKANIDVIKRILTFRRSSVSPQLFEVPVSHKTDLGRVIYANSITLTPGTVTVNVSVLGRFRVHCIDEISGRSLPGEMEKKIAKVFNE